MKPTHWVVTYVDPKTRTAHTSKPYVQRSQARGAAIIAKALGMQSVNLIANWKE